MSDTSSAAVKTHNGHVSTDYAWASTKWELNCVSPIVSPKPGRIANGGRDKVVIKGRTLASL